VLALLLLISASVGAVRIYGDLDSVVSWGARDGDTFYATIPDWPAIIGDSIKIRLSGIDCHEIRKSQDSTHPAQQAKAFTQRVLGDANVISLKNIRRGSFFRIIADVEVDGRDLGQMLIENGLAAECDRRCSRIWVYASRSGTRFHLKSCRHLVRSQAPDRLTLEEASDRDLKPCKVCKPPGFEDVD
jgi:endonuclease YncB( thermonuclease family)